MARPGWAFIYNLINIHTRGERDGGGGRFSRNTPEEDIHRAFYDKLVKHKSTLVQEQEMPSYGSSNFKLR